MKSQKTRTVIAYLRARGWVRLRRGRGSHDLWGLPDETIKATIPTGNGGKPHMTMKEDRMTKREFTVSAERDGKWWVFDIPQLGTGGQALDLAHLESEARDVAATWLDLPPTCISVAVTVTGPEDALVEWSAADNDERAAREAQSRAAARRRQAVRDLRARKYSVRDIAHLLGISKQRVYQLQRP